MKNKFLILLVFLLSFTIFSQEKDMYSFKILDKKTKEPVSYATILLKNLNKGTHADFNGVFYLPKYVKGNDTLVISAIGFKTKKFILSNYKKNIINNIYISEAAFELDEIQITSSKKRKNRKQKKKLTALNIVKKAILNIPLNYPTEPYSYIAHYRDYLQPTNNVYRNSKKIKNQVNYLNLSEGIIEVFDSGFQTKPVENEQNQTLLYKYKLNNKYIIDSTLLIPYDNFHNKLTKTITIQPFGGNELNILNITNPIRNNNSQSISFINTLNKDFLSNHYFKLEGIRQQQNQILYEISFRSKRIKTTRIHNGNGKIYISKNNFAIHKLSYSLYLVGKEIPKYSINLEYIPIDNKMYLDYMTFNNFLEVRNAESTKLTFVGIRKNDFTFIFKFNNPLDFRTLKPYRRSMKLYYKNKKLKIIEAKKGDLKSNKVLLVKILPKHAKKSGILEDTLEDFSKNLFIKFKSLRDADSVKINETPKFEMFQFREMFIQKVFPNKRLPYNKVFIEKNIPLFKAKLAPFDFKNDFWINTPLRNFTFE